ncbi:c-type cytochrome [Gilvimarinus sp. F26214L]|uniref:c-type cytochrome n=1 Tax=Gilvimarinus sp. DZF01 TaxID=3461371 RepID=UPI0040455467
MCSDSSRLIPGPLRHRIVPRQWLADGHTRTSWKRAFGILAVTASIAAGAGCERPASSGANAVGTAPHIDSFQGPLPGTAPAPELPQNPYADDPVAIREGRDLFVQFNCYGCHGGRAGGGMGPSLRDQVWLHGESPAHIFASIAEGRPHGMPAWGTMLSTEQMWKLTAYITSLRTELEPAKP